MLNLNIKTTGAAFYDDDGTPNPGPELARLLRNLADRIEGADGEDGDSGPLYDANGNRAGYFDLDGMERDE